MGRLIASDREKDELKERSPEWGRTLEQALRTWKKRVKTEELKE
jgi:hypothetical protein